MPAFIEAKRMTIRCIQCQSVMEKHGPVESIGYGQNYKCSDAACGEVEFHNVENDPNSIVEIEWAIGRKIGVISQTRGDGVVVILSEVIDSRDFYDILDLAKKGELPRDMDDPNEMKKLHEHLNRTMKEKE